MTFTQHTIALLFLSALLVHFEIAEASDDAVAVVGELAVMLSSCEGLATI